ncbi:MAG TPA: SWIB/MDM2 domain-containing protein [Pyrinomonadaceae bacterium]|nr:SWIB/MDM2 domain-containing protein [Pyrinomonadaceae bacterium]
MPEKKRAGPGKPGGAFMMPVSPDDTLAAIVGSEPLPRTEITKRVWDYIKANNLQDQNDKRLIRADDKLRKVFNGKDEATMFEMTKLVNEHVKR